MNVTTEVKNELIVAMIRHAVKRQAAPTAKAARALDKLWRQLFAKHIALKVPEVPQERWAPLIQEGIFNSMKGEIYLVTNKLDNNKHISTENTSVGEIKIGFGTCSLSERNIAEHKWGIVRRAVEAEWGGFRNFLSHYHTSHYLRFYWKMEHPDLPSIRGLSHVFHPDVEISPNDGRIQYSSAAYKLSQQTDRLTASYKEVLLAAGSMYDNLTQILLTVRTLKQLRDQFPEAVDFLPEEFAAKVKNTKQVADPALVSRARTMLLTGIPD